MSLEAAQCYAWNLACTLEVIIILIETDQAIMCCQVMTTTATPITWRLCRLPWGLPIRPGIIELPSRVNANPSPLAANAP